MREFAYYYYARVGPNKFFVLFILRRKSLLEKRFPLLSTRLVYFVFIQIIVFCSVINKIDARQVRAHYTCAHVIIIEYDGDKNVFFFFCPE